MKCKHGYGTILKTKEFSKKLADLVHESTCSVRKIDCLQSKPFTLIEILFAIVILALSLGVTLSISAQAKGDLIRAKRRWMIQHVLEQATEYFLIANPDDMSVPDDMMPEDFSVQCHVEIVEKGLPEFATVDDYKGWKLGVYTVTIYDESGEFSGEQIVHKLIPKDAEF